MILGMNFGMKNWEKNGFSQRWAFIFPAGTAPGMNVHNNIDSGGQGSEKGA